MHRVWRGVQKGSGGKRNQISTAGQIDITLVLTSRRSLYGRSKARSRRPSNGCLLVRRPAQFRLVDCLRNGAFPANRPLPGRHNLGPYARPASAGTAPTWMPESINPGLWLRMPSRGRRWDFWGAKAGNFDDQRGRNHFRTGATHGGRTTS
jgi:hypothetical protein